MGTELILDHEFREWLMLDSMFHACVARSPRTEQRLQHFAPFEEKIKRKKKAAVSRSIIKRHSTIFLENQEGRFILQ